METPDREDFEDRVITNSRLIELMEELQRRNWKLERDNLYLQEKLRTIKRLFNEVQEIENEQT